MHSVRAINDRPYSMGRTVLETVGAGAFDGPPFEWTIENR